MMGTGIISGMGGDETACERCGNPIETGIHPTAEIEISSDGLEATGQEVAESGSETVRLCVGCTSDLRDFLTEKRDRYLSPPLVAMMERYGQCDHARHNLIADVLALAEERRGPVSYTDYMDLYDEYRGDFDRETDADGEEFAPDDSTGIMDMFDGDIEDMIESVDAGMNAEQVETDDTDAGNGMAVPERDDEDESDEDDEQRDETTQSELEHSEILNPDFDGDDAPGTARRDDDVRSETFGAWSTGDAYFKLPKTSLAKTEFVETPDGRPKSDPVQPDTKLFRFVEWLARQDPNEFVTATDIADELPISRRTATDRLWGGGGAYQKGLLNERDAPGERDRKKGALSVEGRRRVNEAIDKMEPKKRSSFVPLELADETDE